MASDETSPKVFISYSQDSPEHEDHVLEFSNRLCADGIDCNLDQYEISPPEGWPRWMDRQIHEADFILMICTPTYNRRVMGREQPGIGHGVAWESTLIYQYIYNTGTLNTKFIPILFEGASIADIPTPLQGASHYFPSTEVGYEDLYRRLTNQPRTLKPVLGKLRKLLSPERKHSFSREANLSSDITTLRNMTSESAKLFRQNSIYPEQCVRVMNSLRLLDEPVGRMLNAVTQLPPDVNIPDSQLAKTLYYIEALIDELKSLVTTYQPLCRANSRIAMSKKREIQQKLDDLEQNVGSSTKSLEDYADNLLYSVVSHAEPQLDHSFPSPALTNNPYQESSEEKRMKLTHIRTMMHEKYNGQTFRILCVDMGENYDDLIGDILLMKMESLVVECERKNKLDKLVSRMQQDFQNLVGKL